jgi:hypothetical protein
MYSNAKTEDAKTGHLLVNAARIAETNLGDTGPYATAEDTQLAKELEISVEQLRKDRAADDAQLRKDWTDDARDYTLDCQGVCKDCGNGTLNNRLAEAFDYNGDGVYCLNCGSGHVDIISF